MKISIFKLAAALGLAAAATSLMACSKGNGGDNPSSSGPTTNFTVKGFVSTPFVLTFRGQAPYRVLAFSGITHVMAASATGETYVSPLAADGSFSLGINAGTPYTFVLVDDTQIGEDMIVGILKPDAGATGLDTLIPAAAGTAELGAVAVNGTTQVAEMSTTLNDFLSAMGTDLTAATTIGGVDDLTLRMANPDKNADGEIDYYQNFGDIRLDIHVRSAITCTSDCSGIALRISGFAGTYITDVPGFLLSPNGTSIYAIYTSNFQSSPVTTWVPSSGVSTSLSGGATYAATDMPGGGAADIDTPEHYSGAPFANYNSWGPDYSLGSVGIQLPGYDHPVKLTYIFGGKTLSYPYFRSRPKDDLFALIPDFKINTSGGFITSLDYRWMKWNGSAWTAATTLEVGLLVKSDSASFGLYTQKTPGVEENISIKIPTSTASGNIPWTSANVTKSSGVTQAVTAMTLNDFCSGIAGYEDKIGLSIFSHTFGPAATGPAACP